MSKDKSPIIEVAKKVCPAVITIVISKDLPKIEGFYLFPFGGEKFMVPKMGKGKNKQKQKIGGGSGFVVSLDGYVITSNHVVADKDADYTVILEPKKKFPVKVLARDPINDVAILKMKSKKKNFPSLELGNSEETELGEEVVAVGNALGEFHDTLSSGIVSGLSRYITAQKHFSQKTARLRGLIQTDAAVNPGNSGGPLVNLEGEAIGINTAVVMGAQNIGFAIPINYAKKNLEEVKKYGKIKVPFLGVKYILLNKKIAKENKLSVQHGALVVRENLGAEPVVEGSPADKAGIKEYDIILKCDGQKITTKKPLANILQEHKIDDEITLEILRDKKKKTLKTKLQEKK